MLAIIAGIFSFWKWATQPTPLVICLDREGHRWVVLDEARIGFAERGREPTPAEVEQAAKHAPMYSTPPPVKRARRFG
jgi:hypothetical protein